MDINLTIFTWLWSNIYCKNQFNWEKTMNKPILDIRLWYYSTFIVYLYNNRMHGKAFIK
jgi:hypothetical protein